jgi:hypothetical protein
MRGHRDGHNESMDETLALIAQGANAADGNYAAIDRGAPANTSPAPPAATYIVGAIVLTPKVSGIFRITAALDFTDNDSEQVTLTLFAAEPAVPATPITLNGGTPAAQFGSTAAPTSLGETSTVIGTPITVVGGAGAGPKELAVKTVTAVAMDPAEVVITGLFSFSVGGTSKIPFVLGDTCAIYVTVSAPAGTLSAMNLDFSAQELAAP